MQLITVPGSVMMMSSSFPAAIDHEIGVNCYVSAGHPLRASNSAGDGVSSNSAYPGGVTRGFPMSFEAKVPHVWHSSAFVHLAELCPLAINAPKCDALPLLWNGPIRLRSALFAAARELHRLDQPPPKPHRPDPNPIAHRIRPHPRFPFKRPYQNSLGTNIKVAHPHLWTGDLIGLSFIGLFLALVYSSEEDLLS